MISEENIKKLANAKPETREEFNSPESNKAFAEGFEMAAKDIEAGK